MRTEEIFNKPGLEPPLETIAHLPPPPRELVPLGIQHSLGWRILVIILSFLACAVFGYYSFNQYVETANFLRLFSIFVISPICIFFIPWYLISTYQSRVHSFNYYKKIYRNGLSSVGSVTILTQITGTDHDNHLIEKSWTSPFSKVRVDYTFPIDNTIRTGTMLLQSQTVEYLSINTEICILYLKEDPAQNMIFPIPGNEFFNLGKK